MTHLLVGLKELPPIHKSLPRRRYRDGGTEQGVDAGTSGLWVHSIGGDAARIELLQERRLLRGQPQCLVCVRRLQPPLV